MQRHVQAHVLYRFNLLKSSRGSDPATSGKVKSATLIIAAASRDALIEIIARESLRDRGPHCGPEGRIRFGGFNTASSMPGRFGSQL